MCGAIFCIFVPKNLISDRFISKFITKRLVLNEDSLSFIDYKVYPNEKKYNEKHETDESTRASIYFENDSLIVVKERGTQETEFKSNYAVIYDANVPEFNVEYYLASSFKIFKNTIPTKTGIGFAKNLQEKVNKIYKIVLYSLVGIYECVFVTIFTVKLVKSTRNPENLDNTN